MISIPYWLYAVIFAGSLIALFLLIVFSRAGRIRRARVGPVGGRGADPEVSLRAAEGLSELIQFKTVSHDAQGEYGEWVRLREHLKRRYPHVHKTMTRETVGLHSLLYRWPGKRVKGDPLLFCAHLDVVPAEDGWQHPPFAGEIRDGVVWGRGALDCKNTVTCLMEAAEALIAQGFVPSRDIYFAFGHDEELGGGEGAGTMARLFAARDMRFAMVLDEGTSISRGVLSLRRPVAQVAVSEKGMMNVRLTVQSTGGHASDPPRHTALGSLSEAICRVEYKPRPARLTPLIFDLMKELAPYLSFGWRLRVANRWMLKTRLAKFEPAWVRSTMAPTMSNAGRALNVLPPKAEATLNIRLLHGDTGEDLLQYLRVLFGGLGVSVMSMSINEPSKVSDYSGEPFQAIKHSILEVFGKVPVVPALMTAATDARKYENFSDCVYRFSPYVLGPADRAGVHGVDECISAESLGLAVDFYQEVVKRLAGAHINSKRRPPDTDKEAGLFSEPE